MEEARASLADEKLRAAEAAAELERNFIAEKSRMGKEYERKLEAMRASNDEAIERKYDSNVRLILERNREMAEDLRTHVDASEEMRRETRFATAENAELRREMAIKREMEEQYAARGARQRREIAEHKANAASLSASVARLATEFVAEKTKLEGAARDAVATAADDIASTRAVLAAREKELEKLRKLAAEAVRQRNDVERFIVDSLEVVRSEIAEERRAEAAEAAAREPPPFIRRATSDARRRGGHRRSQRAGTKPVGDATGANRRREERPERGRPRRFRRRPREPVVDRTRTRASSTLREATRGQKRTVRVGRHGPRIEASRNALGVDATGIRVARAPSPK